MDIATAIAELAKLSGHTVQVQCIVHKDWALPHWLVYVGLSQCGASTELPTAIAEATHATQMRQAHKGGL